MATMSQSALAGVRLPAVKGIKARRVCVARKSTTMLTDANLIISTANALALFSGRFIFLPFQRAAVRDAGLPVQNGVEYAKAGDIRAREQTGLMKTNDPAGFNLVDVLGWGALGHAAGFAAVAIKSLHDAGIDASPF